MEEAEVNDIRSSYDIILEAMNKIEDENKEVSFEQIKASLNTLWSGIEPMLEIKALNISIVGSMEELKSNKAELENALEKVKIDKETLAKQLGEQEIKTRNNYNKMLKIKNTLSSYYKVKDEIVSSINDFPLTFNKELSNKLLKLQCKFNEEKTQRKEEGQLKE